MTTRTKTTKSALKLSSALKRFAKNERGNTLMMFGAAASVVVATGGAAVDISRRALAKEELAAAVDSGALAACRAWKVSSTTAEANAVKTEQEAQATKFMAANFDETRYSMELPVTTVTYPSTSGPGNSVAGQFRDQIKVKVESTGYVPTTLMKVAGVNSLRITAKSECSRAQGGVELTMALDNTGSMADPIGGTTKIVSLRSATSKMIELLYGNQETSNLVRINIIPYAMAVNIGRQVLDFDDATTADDNANMDFTGAPSGYQSKSDLTSFDPKSPSTLNNASNSKWYGCVIERETSENLGLNADGSAKTLDKNLGFSGSGYNYNDAFDIRDYPSNTVEPTTGKNSGKWKPMIQAYNAGQVRPSHSGYAPASTSGFDPYSTDLTLSNSVQESVTLSGSSNDRSRGGCPAPTVTWKDGLTKTQLKALVASTDYMRPANNTYSSIGMAWAVRLMSPQAPMMSQIQYLDRYSTDTSNNYMGWVKGILLMTDGEIVTSPPIETAEAYWSRGSSSTTQVNYNGYGFQQVGNKVKGYNQTLPNSYTSYYDLTLANSSIKDRMIVTHEQRMLMACLQARKPLGWDLSTNPYKDNDAIRVYTVFFGSVDSSKAQIYKDCSGKDGFFVNATNDAELNNAFSNIASDLQNLRLSL